MHVGQSWCGGVLVAAVYAGRRCTFDSGKWLSIELGMSC